MMTRKDFKRRAADISALDNPVDREKIANMAADECAASNPRFDRVKFLLACGVAA